MATTFALVFAELARHDGLDSNRIEPLASRCGDLMTAPCPSQKAL